MARFLIFAILACCTFGCKNDQNNTNNAALHNMSQIQKSDFGVLPDMTSVNLYTLTNTTGMEVKITNYGGIITSWMAPNKDGISENIVLGYDSLQPYIDNNPYFGAIIGRYGNRIAKGKFSLSEKEYTLAVNNIGNHLHGGILGFDKVLWSATPMEGEEPALQLSYLSPDGEEGYPGNLQVTVTNTLTENNELRIEYKATTDQTTVINLTNHSYFNLSGQQNDILNHELQLNADYFLPVDSTLIPTGILQSVSGTPFDFTKTKAIGKDILRKDEQLAYGGGYDHCWILNNKSDSLVLAATLSEPASGRKLDIFTTEPAIQFYSGNFLDGSITGKNNVVYGHRSGLCLETQHYPDSPNQNAFPSVVLHPGETYLSTTVHRFSIIR